MAFFLEPGVKLPFLVLPDSGYQGSDWRCSEVGGLIPVHYRWFICKQNSYCYMSLKQSITTIQARDDDPQLK